MSHPKYTSNFLPNRQVSRQAVSNFDDTTGLTAALVFEPSTSWPRGHPKPLAWVRTQHLLATRSRQTTGLGANPAPPGHEVTPKHWPGCEPSTSWPLGHPKPLTWVRTQHLLVHRSRQTNGLGMNPAPPGHEVTPNHWPGCEPRISWSTGHAKPMAWVRTQHLLATRSPQTTGLGANPEPPGPQVTPNQWPGCEPSTSWSTGHAKPVAWVQTEHLLVHRSRQTSGLGANPAPPAPQATPNHWPGCEPSTSWSTGTPNQWPGCEPSTSWSTGHAKPLAWVQTEHLLVHRHAKPLAWVRTQHLLVHRSPQTNGLDANPAPPVNEVTPNHWPGCEPSTSWSTGHHKPMAWVRTQHLLSTRSPQTTGLGANPAPPGPQARQTTGLGANPAPPGPQARQTSGLGANPAPPGPQVTPNHWPGCEPSTSWSTGTPNQWPGCEPSTSWSTGTPNQWPGCEPSISWSTGTPNQWPGCEPSTSWSTGTPNHWPGCEPSTSWSTGHAKLLAWVRTQHLLVHMSPQTTGLGANPAPPGPQATSNYWPGCEPSTSWSTGHVKLLAWVRTQHLLVHRSPQTTGLGANPAPPGPQYVCRFSSLLKVANKLQSYSEGNVQINHTPMQKKPIRHVPRVAQGSLSSHRDH